MSDPVEVAIQKALLDHAAAFAVANSLMIAMPNVDFAAPAVSGTAIYLRASFFPADTDTIGIGSGDANRHYGFLQIDVFYSGFGELAAARVAAAVIAYFAHGTSLTSDGFTVKILRQPARRPLIQDDAWICVPVRIFYTCFANPA